MGGVVDQVVERASSRCTSGERGKPKVLWIAPQLNHYKRRALAHLSGSAQLSLYVFAGTNVELDEQRSASDEQELPVRVCNVKRRRFGTSPRVLFELARYVAALRPDVVLMPIEKKLLGPILALLILRFAFCFKLASYNHPCLRSTSHRTATRFDLALTRWIFALFDRVIFYSEKGRDFAISHQLIRASNAYYANNTLDTSFISRLTGAELDVAGPKRLLFIGRLVGNKEIGRLFEYFVVLEKMLPGIELHVIGDGVDSHLVRSHVKRHRNIRWHGALTDERTIAQQINASHAVFVPGSAGLAIVHSFAYGKPFITIRGGRFKHGPEFDFLEDDINGLILGGDNLANDCQRIATMLTDESRYRAVCAAARQSARRLSMENWMAQMEVALAFEQAAQPTSSVTAGEVS